jgi:hypothetical protein
VASGSVTVPCCGRLATAYVAEAPGAILQASRTETDPPETTTADGSEHDGAAAAGPATIRPVTAISRQTTLRRFTGSPSTAKR